MEVSHSEKIQDSAMDIIEEQNGFENFDDVPMEQIEFDNQIDFEKASVENV